MDPAAGVASTYEEDVRRHRLVAAIRLHALRKITR